MRVSRARKKHEVDNPWHPLPKGNHHTLPTVSGSGAPSFAIRFRHSYFGAILPITGTGLIPTLAARSSIVYPETTGYIIPVLLHLARPCRDSRPRTWMG
jgi:hypothetical protein